MLIQIFKGFHIIVIIAWAASLFYVLKIFIYQAKALKQDQPERSVLTGQYKKMIKSVWIPVGWTSAVLVLILGAGLMHPYFSHTWFQVKLILVLFLYILHFRIHFIYKKMQRDEFKYTLATIRPLLHFLVVLMTGIVLLAVLKDNINYLYMTAGLVLLYAVLWGKTMYSAFA